MKKTILLVWSMLALGSKAYTQFYFQDIYNTQQTMATMASLKDNKVKIQRVITLDANMEIDRDFRCERSLSPTYHQMKSQTQSTATGYSSLTSSFSTKGQLTKTVDSSGASITTTVYRYDAQGRLQSVSSNSVARDSKMRFDENRTYRYDTAGHLQQMIQKKSNSTDSVVVTFKTDSAGHVTEELEQRGKRTFYNYDKAGRLTDVYRYQPAKKRMLPDYIFEYDAQGQVTKMTTVNAQTSSYTIWQYEYQGNGLPARETCYGKGKELLGMVKYSYELNP
ncbi:RHS repeat domain-containing protein [Chitinophaga qingshengii]|uniref:RHS repeat protein n=1 Tax=Chitinophaga qingshengii TaxID=1569794 RepID=A0ABR7TNB3_9BACT|nr:RHS repeat protein [Chitinophaga qingshengii]MBC9931971.1 RHS repeat protein [Chitinophaga qingshengii]